MERKITHLQVGEAKYNVGTNGVKMLEVQPPLAGVDYGDYAVAIYAPMETMIWHHKEDLIAVPKLVMDGDA